MKSPYQGKDKKCWLNITRKLINKHPLNTDDIISIVVKSWDSIFSSKIGSFYIGKQIFPSPQIISFFLHELIAHYIELEYPKIFKIGQEKYEKDIQHIINSDYSIEIKASSHKSQVFGNRSYAQPKTIREDKNKDGYYITINFEKISLKNPEPKINIIRFGYLEHSDWVPQKSATGQQARLTKDAYEYKLLNIYKIK